MLLVDAFMRILCVKTEDKVTYIHII